METRQVLRQALYNLPKGVEGLVKTYQQPFSPLSPSNPDGHEALSKAHIVLGRFAEDDAIELIGP